MANNNVRIKNNEIFEAGAYYNLNNANIPMTEFVKRNILSDYKIGGVKTQEAKIFVNNVYNTQKELVKKINNGDLVEVNDVCVLIDANGESIYKNADGKPVYWKVISRTFNYDGQPILNLKFQEIKGGI